ncbi:MAG TPA: ABC transporter substrate-binding protein [Gaiellaceae bacterium]|nr:ABC transporter substrate-binding protein [Gaiellaceae bacterium]
MTRLPRRLLLVAALVLVVVPAGVGGSTATPAQLTTVTIATLPLEPASLAFYAKHRGFFTKQGLEAKLLVVSEPQQLVAALLSGDVQFSGFNVGGAAILKSRDAPVRLVAAGAMYRRAAPTSAVVAAPGKRITRARELVGKTIAIDAANTIAHIGLLKWLKGNGVSASDVRLVELPFPQMLGPLRRGQVDAAVLPEPYLTLALERGAKRVANVIHAVCAQDCLSTIWMAREDLDTTLAARFRNAIQAAAVWANKPANHAASGAILARYAPIDRAVIAKMTRSRFSERLRPALAQPWIDAFAEFGVIPASFRAIDLVR